MGYLTAKQFSEKWGISERRVIKLCMENRINGAIKNGRRWSIPEDTLKPSDKRSGISKYIKTKKTVAIVNINKQIGEFLVPLLEKEGYAITIIYEKNKKININKEYELRILETNFNNTKSVLETIEKTEKYYDSMVFLESEKIEKNGELIIREFSKKMNCTSSIVLVNNVSDIKQKLEQKLAKEFKEEIGLRINAVNLDIPVTGELLVNYKEIAIDIATMVTDYKNTTGNSITTDGDYIEFDKTGKTKPLCTGKFYKVLDYYFKSLNKDSYLWCASTMMEDEWTEEPAEMNFRVSNLEAANRGAKIDRIFIFSKSKIKEFRNNKTLKIYMQSNMNTLFVDYDEIMKKNPKLIEIVGNGWDGIDKHTLILDLPAGNKERGYVSINREEVEEAYNCFQELKKYSKDLKKVLKN